VISAWLASRAFGLLLALLVAAACGAEPEDARYAGLVPGAEWTYEVRYRHEGRFETEQAGRTLMRIDGTEERGGHRYHRVRTESSGFENLPSSETLTRVADDGVRTLAAGNEAAEERLVLPFPAVPGRTWSVSDGNDQWRYVVEASDPIEVPAGRFEDCIRVVNTLESENSKFAIVEHADLCAGVGRVRVRAEATSEMGVSITETTLIGFQR
jgi:hypothetical protein